ncbi:hypothetical protein HDV63DRAFT_400200 [Trichoderma sp. SZMC 28014]
MARYCHIALGYHVPCAAFLESNSAMDGYLDGLLRIPYTLAVIAAGLFAFYCFTGWRFLKETDRETVIPATSHSYVGNTPSRRITTAISATQTTTSIIILYLGTHSITSPQARPL